MKDQPRHAGSRHRRLKLFGFCALMLVTGGALGATAGPPRLPGGLPAPEVLLELLLGSTIPVDGLLLILVDAAWMLWTWIVLSLLIQLVLVGAEVVAHGSRWLRSVRQLADRLSVPLVRRGVAAAFAVQVIGRGVPVAAAQSLPPVETVLVTGPNEHSSSAVAVSDASDLAPTYLVREGDTLWSIAEKAYGSGTDYRRLLEANLGRSMSDGQVFSARGVIQPGWRLIAPGATWNVENLDGERWYTVRPGDTLSSIAAAVLADSSRWNELFELNRGAAGPDGLHTLVDPDTIWPGLRLRLPDPPVDADDSVPQGPTAEADANGGLLVVASASPKVEPDPPITDSSGAADPVQSAATTPPSTSEVPPLARTPHAPPPVLLDDADTSADPADGPPTQLAEPAASGGGSDAAVWRANAPWRADLPALPIALGGIGLAGLAGAVLGARRLRRLRPLPQEPESDAVVQGGFAEAQLTHDLTRGLHGVGFDPVVALVTQVDHFLAEHNLGGVGVVAVRHGRSSTTLTLRCGLVEQPMLLDLAPVFAERLGAEVDACVSTDQDVVLRLVRLRKTRLLPIADAVDGAACVVPLGVLFDRQVYSATWQALGHVLIVSLPGHGADTILTSLVATVTARRSPEHQRVWLFASPRALPGPLFELPHLTRVVDPADRTALAVALEELRAELDARTGSRDHPDLLVAVAELGSLGEHADRLALMAARAADVGVRFVVACSAPEEASGNALAPYFVTRMVLRMQSEEASVALLGVADAAFLGGGGRLLVRVDGREPVELYGYQVAAEHLERLVKVMQSAYPMPATTQPEPATSQPSEPPTEPPAADSTPTSEPPARESTPPAEADCAVDQASAVVAPIQITCFGTPRVLCAGRLVWPRNGGDAKPWELLLYLACQPAEGVARDEVVQAMWPDDELPEDAGHRFRQLRYRLRRQLQLVPGAPDTDGVCLDRRQLRLDPALVYSDAQEFLAQIRSVRVNPGPDAIERLERARALYVGDLLEGPDARRYTWLDERDDSGVTLREHFRRLFQNASVRLAELYTADGTLEPAIELYRELTEIDPADERLWQALFRLHAQRRDRQGLVDEEQRLRRILRDLAEELDLPAARDTDEPSREITEEFQRLLAGLHDREPATV